MIELYKQRQVEVIVRAICNPSTVLPASQTVTNDQIHSLETFLTTEICNFYKEEHIVLHGGLKLQANPC